MSSLANSKDPDEMKHDAKGLSGRVLELRGCRFEAHCRLCVVSLSKTH